MPEEIKNETAETTDGAGAVGVDGNADVDKENTDTDAEAVNDADFSDGDAKDSEDPEAKEDKPAEEKPKSKDANAENARRRREAERKAELEKARQEAREAAIIETLGGKNPYTNEEMKDSADVREYLAMREIEKEGGDPLTDYAKHVKKKEKEAEAAAKKQSEDAEWYKKDYENFSEKYPDVKLDELIGDPLFQKYSDGRVGRMPLSELYEGFCEITAGAEKRAENKAKQTLANKKASPGALSGANPSDSGFFTKEQVRAMSPEEIRKNYDKIRASMSKW